MPEKTIKQNETNLVWIDLEMTGLDPEKDTILEIAVIVTGPKLRVLYKGIDLVIKHPQKVLDNMNDWCKEHFGKSGLAQKSLESKISMKEAEEKVLIIIKNYCVEKKAILCGSSVHVDKRFLIKHMPKLANFLHYRLIDVSTVKELCRRWFPKYCKDTKEEDMAHRAFDDIKKSIEELKFYRKNVFIRT